MSEVNQDSGYQQGQGPSDANALSTERHSVHSSYIWLGSIRMALFIFLIIAASAGQNLAQLYRWFDGMGWQSAKIVVVLVAICIGVIIISFGISLAYRIFSYKRISYQLTPSEFELFTGIFNRKRVHVPYQRVQSVDQKASLLQRAVGVCSVSIDTAGGSSNKAILVPYVTKAQAESLRTELFKRKLIIMNGGVVPTSDSSQGAAYVRAGGTNVLDSVAGLVNEVEADLFDPELFTGKVSYEHGLSNKELFFAGLSGRTAFTVAFLGVLLAFVSFIADFLDESFFDATIAYMSAGKIAWIVAGSVLAASLIVWIVSICASLLSLGGFRARRRETRIEVEYGILQHTVRGVDIDKVQSITIEQGFIRKLIGYCGVYLGKIDAAGTSDTGGSSNTANAGKIIVHPFVKVDRVPEIVAGLLPEFSDDVARLNANFIPVPKKAKSRAIKRHALWFNPCFWISLFCVVLQLVCNLVVPRTLGSHFFVSNVLPQINYACLVMYALFVILAIFGVIKAIRWHKASGFAVTRDYALIRNGGWGSVEVVIPRKRIQYAGLRSNPFQRRAQTASIKIRTAAGIGGYFLTLVDASEMAVYDLMEWYKPRRRD